MECVTVSILVLHAFLLGMLVEAPACDAYMFNGVLVRGGLQPDLALAILTRRCSVTHLSSTYSLVLRTVKPTELTPLFTALLLPVPLALTPCHNCVDLQVRNRHHLNRFGLAAWLEPAIGS